MDTILFTVLGVPQPQGSMRSFRHKHTGVIITKSDNPRLHSWRQDTGAMAQRAMKGREPLAGAICVDATFQFVRPKSVSEKRRPLHIVKPDADKLTRGLLDALTGIAWRDDAQVVRLILAKRYGPVAETRVQITEIE